MQGVFNDWPAETVRQRPWKSVQGRGDRHAVSHAARSVSAAQGLAGPLLTVADPWLPGLMGPVNGPAILRRCASFF